MTNRSPSPTHARGFLCFLLINVHVPYAGQVPGTDTHISYQDLDGLAGYIGTDLETRVVVYCLTNFMALIAGEDLLARGYRAVYYLDGGMRGWEGAGFGLEQ